VLWLLTRRFYSAYTGWRTLELPYKCALCSHECTARVVTQGFGTANHQEDANAIAERSVHDRASAALASTQCPSCASFPSEIVAKVEAAKRKQARRSRWRHPLGFATAVGVASLGGALTLFMERPALWISVAGSAVCAWAIVVLAFSAPVYVPPWVGPANVWFPSSATYREALRDWVAASSLPVAPGPTPMPARPGSGPFWKALAAAIPATGVALIGVLVAVLLSRNVCVANPLEQAITIRIDGETVGVIDAAPRFGDAMSSDTWFLPSGRHVVEALDEHGVLIERAHVSSEDDVLFVPRGRELSVCVVAERVRYARWPVEAEPRKYEVLANDTNLWDLGDVRPTYYFTEPPESLEVEEWEFWRTETGLRAVDCAWAEGQDAM
jgi:hypothetical protein